MEPPHGERFTLLQASAIHLAALLEAADLLPTTVGTGTTIRRHSCWGWATIRDPYIVLQTTGGHRTEQRRTRRGRRAGGQKGQHGAGNNRLAGTRNHCAIHLAVLLEAAPTTSGTKAGRTGRCETGWSGGRKRTGRCETGGSGG